MGARISAILERLRRRPARERRILALATYAAAAAVVLAFGTTSLRNALSLPSDLAGGETGNAAEHPGPAPAPLAALRETLGGVTAGIRGIIEESSRLIGGMSTSAPEELAAPPAISGETSGSGDMTPAVLPRPEPPALPQAAPETNEGGYAPSADNAEPRQSPGRTLGQLPEDEPGGRQSLSRLLIPEKGGEQRRGSVAGAIRRALAGLMQLLVP
ncbi:MAG: hypothetical protein A3B37_01510 [Candidatus Sungbacteria bacterium RIFCSPLOWO2_01_FULL_59_16]|uniref:Uncharacterized protein n=1 Tax=Candidatus Sungbacteria bacterium RIFCSPLOWO2_01_FULL_59_16 TaxID=1802280 RepID=A0A1G2LEG6_9BACT|nr:MAG: hypothetical protein A3B37_01510 [Candidatus Sungbacteria bacterium RIFCSPLOWO2_01_FULL_59_16]